MKHVDLRQGDVNGNKDQYRFNVLVHNWYEAQHEPTYESGHTRLYSDREKAWQTEYRKTIGGAKADGHLRDISPFVTVPQASEEPFLTETAANYTDPTDKPFTIRKYIGGKKMEPQDKSFAERTTEYIETWTSSSLKTRERMKSEAHRSFVSPSQQVHAELRLFDIPAVDLLREKVWRRGGKGGFRGLARVLRIFDENGRKRLDRYELENALQSYGLYLKPQEMDQVMAYFDRDGAGMIAVPDFLRSLRGTMSNDRKALVGQAYGLLDALGHGVTFQAVRQWYDVSQHPDVQCRSKTQEQVTAEFLGGWDKEAEDLVSWADFLDFYEDISTGIDSDDYFELMMRNAWHLSGGEGVRANTSCRRVLVVHGNGHSTVEEIKNDLGVTAEDMGSMVENLRAQGIVDIKRIQLYS